MRSPKIILENLQKHSKEENYKYERLYRNLYNEDFYLQALQNIYANKGAMTPIAVFKTVAYRADTRRLW